MTVGELFITLGFKADTMKLKDFMNAVGELNMRSVMSAVGLGTLYEATAKIMGIADQAGMSVWNFAETTGISGKSMTQFAYYAEQMGSSVEDAQASLKNLQMAMFNVSIGRGNMEPFILTGIDPTKVKDQFEVLQKIGEFLRGPASDAVKRMVVAEFGLSESMIPVLKNTQSLNQALKGMGYIYDTEIKKVREFHQANKELGQSLQQLAMFGAKLLTPTVNALQKIASGAAHIARREGGWGEFFGGLARMSPLANVAGLVGAGVASHVVNNNQKIDINISETSNPVKIGEAVYRKLTEVLTDTYYHQSTQSR
jgi:hypothetical protein